MSLLGIAGLYHGFAISCCKSLLSHGVYRTCKIEERQFKGLICAYRTCKLSWVCFLKISCLTFNLSFP